MNQMNPMKLKYKNEILLFFIVVFGFIILYYGLGKICNKRPIIEGITSSNNNPHNNTKILNDRWCIESYCNGQSKCYSKRQPKKVIFQKHLS